MSFHVHFPSNKLKKFVKSTYNLDTIFVSLGYVDEKGRNDDGEHRSNCRHPEELLVLFSLIKKNKAKIGCSIKRRNDY